MRQIRLAREVPLLKEKIYKEMNKTPHKVEELKYLLLIRSSWTFLLNERACDKNELEKVTCGAIPNPEVWEKDRFEELRTCGCT